MASIACTDASKGPLSFTHYRGPRSTNAFRGLCNEHSQSCALHHCRLAVGHAVVIGGARTPEPPSRALQIVEAVWKVQSLSFAYSGYATVYSCDALLDKVRAILQILGARETLRIRSWGCTDMVTHGRMDITLESPVEATPENIQALTTYDSTQELVARVRNEQLTSAEDLRRFPATWKTISMSRDRQLKLGPSDCELVDQLSRDVLPRMAIRVEHDRLRCSAVFGNIGQPQLRVAALVALPEQH